MTSDLMNKYFEWLYSTVCSDDSYRKLCAFLFDQEFIYIMPYDDNRYEDGVDIRYHFGYDNNIPNSVIAIELDDRPCSIFEMMVALAVRIETDIMSEEAFGNRTSKWFMDMLRSLGLDYMTNTQFNKTRATYILDTFIHRKYQYNGQGGLFTVYDPPRPLYEVEIWYQAMWYLNEVSQNERR